MKLPWKKSSKKLSKLEQNLASKSVDKQPPAKGADVSATSPKTAALRKALENEPDKRINVTAQQTVSNVMAILKDDNGVRIEDALGIIGAFAGYFSSLSGIDEKKKGSSRPLNTLTTQSGETLVVGPAINDFLVTNPRSLFNLVCAGMQMAGETDFPDALAISKRHLDTIGTDDFGIPVLPEVNVLRDTPRALLINLWPVLQDAITEVEDDSPALCMAMGVAAQDLIVKGKQVLDPKIAGEIVMQSAYATSAITPADAASEMRAAIITKNQS